LNLNPVTIPYPVTIPKLEKDPEKYQEMDLETDPESHPKLGSELDPDSWQSALQIAQSAVAFASGLPQFYNKLRNCQACSIPLSNFYCWL
jgi:hypothetical protein